MKRLIVCGLIWATAGGAAQALPVTVTAGGTAFEGGPAFEMRLGDVVIGTGQVADPVPEGGEEFSFEVDDALFAGNPELSLVLTNDRYVEGAGDRNLEIFKVQVGALELLPADFLLDGPNDQDQPFTGLLGSNSRIAHVSAPPAGWISSVDVTTETAVPAETPAVTATAETPETRATDAPVAVEETPEVAEAAPAAAPAPAAEPAPAAAPAPAAEPVAPMAESAAPVAEMPEVEPALACGPAVTVTGFANNAVTLTAAQQAILSEALDSLAGCSLVVTGYSSQAGSDALNQAVSEARAQAVADYLAGSDTPPEAVEVVGFGSTAQFDGGAAGNRRVVVEVSP